MPSHEIGKHYESMIADLLAIGRYASSDDVLRAGLRLLEENEQRRLAKLEALRAEIEKGIDSGPAEEFDPEILADDIKRRGRERLESEQLAAKNG